MKIVVFSGAGISQESGLDTFRKSGLWDGLSVHEVANINAWHAGNASRQRMLDFYNTRRRECHRVHPNAAHLALKSLEDRGHEVVVVTQNVDNLHERAGSSNVIHLHGELMKVRPETGNSEASNWISDLNLGDIDAFGNQLRPHIVWFGETLTEFERGYAAATAPDVDVLIIVGTTLEVGPANLCAFDTQAAHVFLTDPQPPEFSTLGTLTVIRDRATIGIPIVCDQIR